MHPVDAVGPDPAEHDVAGRLHEPLTLDDPLAVVGVLALAQEGLQHRRLGLLGLQEQRVAVVVAEHQHDPGAGADAAHADHLAGGVHVAEALQQVPVVACQRAAVGAQHVVHRVLDLVVLAGRQQVLDRDDQWRIADELRPPVDDLRRAC